MSAPRAALRPYRLRLRAPLRTSHGTLREREGVEVHVHDGRGATGLGEAAPLPSFGTEDLPASLRALEQAVQSIDASLEAVVSSPEAIDRQLSGIAALRDAPAARCGLELALLDLGAQEAGLPLARWLSAEARDEVQVSALLADGEVAAPGFATVKVKVGARSLADDVARVAAVRRAVAPGVRIRLDANGAWTEARAAEALAALAPLQIELCEQPIAPGDPAAWPRLRRCGVALAADESLADPAEADALLAGGAVDAVVLKPQALGGVLRALSLARRARAAGIGCIATTSLEGAIGRAGAAHLAAALGGPFAHGLATGDLLAEDLAPDGLAPLRGRIFLSAAPGLGLGAIECPVARQARTRPGAPALVFRGEAISYAALDAQAGRIAARLRERGVREGDRVALLSDSCPEAVALIHGAARCGAALALLNARLLPAELQPQLALVRPALVVAQQALRAQLPGAASLEELAHADDAQARAPSGAPTLLRLDRAQTILFTSGTTGRSKAAQLTAWAHLCSARSAARLLDLDERTRWLCSLPLFHVGGLSIVQRCALAGGAALLHERFDAATAARALCGDGATHASLVATTLQRTLDAWGELPAPRALRAALVGGGPAPAPLLERARRAGIAVLHTYGLTEAGSHVTCERPAEADGATAGPAVPGTEVRIDAASGEIEVRGPTLFSGYLADDDATRAALRDGWLRTGDLGELDARGRLIVHARRSDLIVSGGENVYPAEVEAALLAHPAVAEAAVAPRDDPEWGQAVAAAVVLRAPCTEAELASHLRARLAPFKQPRAWLFVPSLPRNAAGKVDRAALRALFSR